MKIRISLTLHLILILFDCTVLIQMLSQHNRCRYECRLVVRFVRQMTHIPSHELVSLTDVFDQIDSNLCKMLYMCCCIAFKSLREKMISVAFGRTRKRFIIKNVIIDPIDLIKINALIRNNRY